MRQRHWRWILIAAGLLGFLVTGCSGQTSDPEINTTIEPAESRPARTLPIPPGSGSAPATNTDTPAAGGELAWEIPEGWSELTPTSRMRHAQYQISGPGGIGECVVYYFGPGQGGDAASNARRWAGQFRQPDGSSAVEAMKMERLDGTKVQVQLVEVSGTYDGGMTMTDQPAQQKTGYRLLGAIAEGPDAPWFFKFTGPEDTVRAQRDAFVGMMRSIHESE